MFHLKNNSFVILNKVLFFNLLARPSDTYVFRNSSERAFSPNYFVIRIIRSNKDTTVYVFVTVIRLRVECTCPPAFGRRCCLAHKQKIIYKCIYKINKISIKTGLRDRSRSSVSRNVTYECT